MTEAERQMMDDIHLHGMILSLDDDAQKTALDYIEAAMKEERLRPTGGRKGDCFDRESENICGQLQL